MPEPLHKVLIDYNVDCLERIILELFLNYIGYTSYIHNIMQYNLTKLSKSTIDSINTNFYIDVKLNVRLTGTLHCAAHMLLHKRRQKRNTQIISV